MELIDYLKDDHDTVRILMHEIDLASEMKKKREFFNELKMLLRAHFRAEELVLYSKSLKLQDASINKMALDIYEEHRFIEDFVYKIQSSISDEQWISRLRIFFQILEINFDGKESEYFVEIRKRLSVSQLNQAAVLYLKAKTFEESHVGVPAVPGSLHLN